MARPAGFEPATPSLEGSCSIRLSYGRVALSLACFDKDRNATGAPRQRVAKARPSCPGGRSARPADQAREVLLAAPTAAGRIAVAAGVGIRAAPMTAAAPARRIGIRSAVGIAAGPGATAPIIRRIGVPPGIGIGAVRPAPAATAASATRRVGIGAAVGIAAAAAAAATTARVGIRAAVGIAASLAGKGRAAHRAERARCGYAAGNGAEEGTSIELTRRLHGKTPFAANISAHCIARFVRTERGKSEPCWTDGRRRVPDDPLWESAGFALPVASAGWGL